MPKRVRRRIRRSAIQQRELVERFQSSGLDAKRFCHREGVALSSLQRWRQRSVVAEPAGFVELLPASPSTPASASWSVELMLPGGICLRVGS